MGDLPVFIPPAPPAVQPDIQETMRVQQELLRQQLLYSMQVQQATIANAAQRHLQTTMQYDLESYAAQLEQWANQPGRSAELQQYVHGIAKELRDSYTTNVLERLENVSRQLTEAARKEARIPEQPVIDVTPTPDTFGAFLKRKLDELDKRRGYK